MHKNHVMIDLETLGIDDDAVILSIGAVSFNPYKAGVLITDDNSVCCGIDIFDQLMKGRVIDNGTVDWWRKQSPEALDHQTAFVRLPLNLALTELFDFIRRIDPEYVWAMPPKFDLGKIAHAANQCALTLPWNHRQEMDVRAFRAAVPMVWGKPTTKYNSPTVPPCPPPVEPSRAGVYHSELDDAVFQAELVQWAVRNLSYGPA